MSNWQLLTKKLTCHSQSGRAFLLLAATHDSLDGHVSGAADRAIGVLLSLPERGDGIFGVRTDLAQRTGCGLPDWPRLIFNGIDERGNGHLNVRINFA